MSRLTRAVGAYAAAGASVAVVVLVVASGVPALLAHQGSGGQQSVSGEPAPSTAELEAAIDVLGAFDYETRMNAARTVRRAAPAEAAGALAAAARAHADEYVRYRALVLLAGIGESAAAGLMRDAVTDRNDRMRTVAFAWFEHHPDPAVLPALLEALEREGSEFVRPALTRAVAAQGADPRAREALLPLVLRGEDYFRGAVLEALGDYKARYALEAITSVARLDGPLQDDAITAIGRIGAPESVDLLVELQGQVPRELQPTVSAALCLLGRNCGTHVEFVLESLRFGAANPNFQPLLRGAVHGAGMLARAGRDEAFDALVDAGVRAGEPARSPIALGVGLIALRTPDIILRGFERRDDRDAAILLLRDAFDMLSEDFEEERFYVHIRRAFWAAPAGSPRRALAEVLIQRLEF